MKKNIFKSKKTYYLLSVVLIVLIINIVFLFSINKDLIDRELQITLITANNCENCFDLTPFADYFVENGVDMDQIRAVDYQDGSAKTLLKKFEITKVPAFIITGGFTGYDFVEEMLNEEVGRMTDNAFVLTQIQPPYIDIDQDKVVGEFELVYLDDFQCDQCYEVNTHDEILERLAMTPSKKTIVDINSEEGRLLVDGYYITAVPTFLLRGDLEEYIVLNQLWDQVGSIEDDGTYILRQGVQSMGAYKTLPEGEIIFPEEEL